MGFIKPGGGDGVGMTDPMTTRGDMIYRDASAPARLAVGTANQALGTDGTDPVWQESAKSVLTDAGDLLYADGANSLARLAKGTDGEVLTLASGLPSWAAAAGGALNPTEIDNTDSPYTVLSSDTLIMADATSGAITVDLLALASGNPIWIVKQDSSTNAITIDGNSTETITDRINGAATTITLYLQGDSVYLVPISGDSWYVMGGQLQPHQAEIRRQSSQTFSSSTSTKVQLSTLVKSRGISADTSTNYRLTVARSGRYLATSFIRFASAAKDSGALNLFVDGSNAQVLLVYNSGGDIFVDMQNTAVLTLTAGQYVELYATQYSAGNENSSATSVYDYPKLSLEELGR